MRSMKCLYEHTGEYAHDSVCGGNVPEDSQSCQSQCDNGKLMKFWLVANKRSIYGKFYVYFSSHESSLEKWFSKSPVASFLKEQTCLGRMHV